ncbi:Polynucleotide 5'-hydroxyl-kinase grc3 [Exophiala xenobiotica]|uniref:Polynucleotide 5'-hydroxyl-kinase grc3 n=1 Tax=Lithohypha guttulata TaxID=1690604 RepID=A0ABR0KE00_9EURO|nr:Polynucleotide 5'-hydroxyl-kinase grc3 [Lithohypha guttulata]KAK5321038.1 Polynucleotide 5'-hydroxyl-kinase grc3 [Exophiala xenobiotica]
MSTGPRESAFAKRRRLNDGTSAPTSDSDLSVATTVVKKTKAKKHAEEARIDAVRAVSNHADVETLHEGVPESSNNNSFQPLASANEVKFTGSREIESLDDGTVKVRLSQSQSCYLYGIAKLWVRDGSVSVHGATLTESISTYTLFAPVSDAPTPIVAQSKIAEFQLESVAHADSAVPSPSNVPGKFGRAVGSSLSFRVLDHDDEYEYSGTQGIRYSSFPSTNGTSHTPTVPIKVAATPASRILICGNRSGDTSAYCVSLINKSLSDSFKQQGTLRNGVAFLDLDYSSPAFVCPALDSTSSNRLVASHYIGSDEQSNVKAPNQAIIEYLMKVDRSSGDLPWVIRTGAWLATASTHELVQLYKTLAPHLVVCIDSSKSSPHYDAATTLTQTEPTKFAHIPCLRSTSSSSLSQHRNALQSHFRLCGYVEDVPLWYEGWMPIGARQLLLLTIGRERELSFVSISGGVLRYEDILEALEGALVTLIAARFGTKAPSDAARMDLRNIDDPEESRHLGLAHVEGIDELAGSLRLNTPVVVRQIQECLDAGFEIGVVLRKPGPSGRFGRQLLFE